MRTGEDVQHGSSFEFGREGTTLAWHEISPWLVQDSLSSWSSLRGAPQVSANRIPPKLLDKAVIDKVGVTYVPRVPAVTPGTQVVFRNQKSPCQGFQVSGSPRSEHIFNYNIREGTERTVTFRSPDLCAVTCALRPYSKGYIRVVDTPYFAVTDAEGEFAIRNVPKVEYLVTLWHEGTGNLPKDAGLSEIAITEKGDIQLTYRAAIPQNRFAEVVPPLIWVAAFSSQRARHLGPSNAALGFEKRRHA